MTKGRGNGGEAATIYVYWYTFAYMYVYTRTIDKKNTLEKKGSGACAFREDRRVSWNANVHEARIRTASIQIDQRRCDRIDGVQFSLVLFAISPP